MSLRAAALALVLLLARPVPSLGQAASPHLFVNDTDVTREITPQVQDGTLLLPADVVARAFGAAAAWDPTAQTLTLTGAAGTVVRLVPGQPRAQVDGIMRDLPVVPILRDGAVWAPAAAVLRALGAYLVDGDDGHTQTALAQVTNVSWRPDGGGLAVRVTATGPVRVDAHVLHQPERLVVDVAGAVARLPGAAQEVDVGGVARVRGGQFQLHPFITRIVFDLDRPLKFTVASRPGEIAVVLGDTAGVPAAQAPAAPHAPAAAAAPPVSAASAPATAAGAGMAPVPAAQPPAPAASPAASPASTPPAASPDASGAAQEPLAIPPLPEFTDRPGAFHVEAVAYDDQGRTGRIVIRASQRVTYALHEFVYPQRLAIDITGGVYLARRHDIEVGSEMVRNIVVSQFQLKPNLTRVLVHLNRKMPYSAAVADAGRTLIVTLGNPGRRLARGSAVIIDPGHGGADGGAVGPSGVREADVALSISRLVRDALTGQGIASVMTRTDDATIPLEERPDLAQRNGGVLFVSIHANASRNSGAAGTETYYKTAESQALARVVQAEVTQALGEPDRGIRTADFYVLVNTPMPAVLVETAFITNPAEEAMLRDPAVQRRIADAIARAIAKYLRGSSGTAP